MRGVLLDPHTGKPEGADERRTHKLERVERLLALAAEYPELVAMADNVGITPGSGAIVAADEIPAASGIYYQRVKNGWGADGVWNDVSLTAPLPVQQPPAANTYGAASFRLAGAASSPTNLLTIENTAGSGVVVAVRRIAIDVVSVATAYVVNANFRLWHRTGVTPTGGTQATKQPFDGNMAASAANVIVRMSASADGTASVITHALPATNPFRAQAHPTNMTAVGQWLADDNELQTYAQAPIILRAGDTMLAALVGNSATTLSYTIKVIWEEV